jgi:tetratricopeptide (TPR) repeat protein/SAM-dependent methyltransferase
MPDNGRHRRPLHVGATLTQHCQFASRKVSFHKPSISIMNREQRRGAQPPGTVPAFGSAANTAPAGTVADLFNAAVAHHRAGAFAEAERGYRHILTLSPSHLDALHNLGLIVLQNGDATAAVELLGKAISLNDRVADFHYSIALAWRALKRSDHVAAHLEWAISIRNDYTLAHLNLGNVRREQGRLADAIACYERTIELDPKSAAAYFNLANALAEQGRWDAAVDRYRRVLAFEPNHAETHSRLGAALMILGKTSEAVSHFDRTVALDPNLPGAHEDLGKASMSAGNLNAAIPAAARAVELRDTPQNRELFAECIRFVRFRVDDARLRKLLLRALLEGWARPRDLTGVCISLIKLDSAVIDGIARANAAWPARLPAPELFGTSEFAALADNELLCSLLGCDALTDIGLERLLTNVRSAMLAIAAGKDAAGDDRHLEFFSAVARQCFSNDYVYALPETEASAALDLRSALAKAIEDGAPIPALWPIAVGAYFPLCALPNADALSERSWPQCVETLLVQQVKEPAQERQVAATIPLLTGIDGEVSRAVRQQYEENPYPRWVKAATPVQALMNHPEHAPDALIAGCGTGLSTMELARQLHHPRILAVDLSLASLSYAKRMAQSLGLTNIEFAQADITKLAAIGRDFDFIDASGVLHHLADPWEGWRVLLSLLRPGGMMQVGLYSELGRSNVVAARALIAERGYLPIPDDIRRCREDIIASGDVLLNSLTQCDDFFTINECRDLLFHVQEHRIDLREIKSFLAANDVQFAGFLLDAPKRHRFAARFPERASITDLECWLAFEAEAPDTFAGMYQFQVRKPQPANANLAKAD